MIMRRSMSKGDEEERHGEIDDCCMRVACGHDGRIDCASRREDAYDHTHGRGGSPGPGDPDGSGEAKITLNSGKGELCYELSVTGISSAIAAHIHVGPAGVAGPVVVPLAAPTEGTSSGCASVDPDLIKTIMKNPEQYYVNVHNVDFPAVRCAGSCRSSCDSGRSAQHRAGRPNVARTWPKRPKTVRLGYRGGTTQSQQPSHFEPAYAYAHHPSE